MLEEEAMEISIIVPFHKGRNYLIDCLESICDQNLLDYETILILDHVEEKIDDLLDRFSDTAGLKIVRLDGKRGAAAARNLGLSKAVGNYVYFLDSDDYLLEDSLDQILQRAKKENADLVAGSVVDTWYKRRSFLEEYEKEELPKMTVEDSNRVELCFEGEASVLGKLWKREFLLRYEISFPEALMVYSDTPFVSKGLRACGRFALEKRSIYVKRKHNDPVLLPSLEQKEIPDRHMQYVKSFLLSRKEAEGQQELIHRLECDFLRYFIHLYQKSFLPKPGQILPGNQFETVCDAVKECSRERIQTFSYRERKLVEGFLCRKEKRCIFYGTLSMGLSKFKKSKTKQTAIYRVLDRVFFQKLPLKENWIVFESFLGKNYADSCKYIYRYLDETYPGKYKCIWVLQDPSRPVEGSAVKVKYMGLMHFYYASRAKYWVNNMRQPIWREKRRGQIFLETWHGTPLKKLVFDMEDVHSATATYKSDFYRQSRQWDYLLSDNPFSTQVFESAFLFPREKMLEYGYPRNDILHWKNRDEIAEKIRKKLGIPMDKKTVLYAPTWRDDEYYGPGRYKFHLALDLAKMKEALSDEYVILLRTHYFIADQLDLSGYEGFAYNLSRYDDISELYLISDICITDYSSVFFDYANLLRPMLFYTYDLEKYRDILRGFYIDMEEEVPGPLLYTTEEVIEAIRHIDQVEEEFRERYRKFYRRFCCWDDGFASKRIVKDVFGVSNEEENSNMD